MTVYGDKKEQARIICLAGPTASGKTTLALTLARELGCEIINADSRQIYSDFPIITAQPEESEKLQAPHHLYGFLETNDKLNACSWARLAHSRACEIISRGRLPLVVGGSGFYFQALLEGLPDIPPIDPAITTHYSRQIAVFGSVAMHSRLEKIDPAYAAKIHPHDKQRVERALAVYSSTGKTFSWWHEHSKPMALANGPLFVLDSSLGELEPVFSRRIDKMEKLGAKEEIARAWKKCPDSSAPGWSGIGCREALAYLQGQCGWEDWRGKWLANTRAYAKRQITWFRGRQNSIPVRLDDMKGLVRRVKAFI